MKVDVAILGSGFAGSLCALILNKMGRSVVLIDKAVHPRFTIGESSTPIGNMVLRDLAERYDLPFLTPLVTYGTWRETYPHLNVGRKRGFSYFQHQLGNPFTPDAQHTNELIVASSREDYRSDTHWLRADIDHFLLSKAREAGISIYENTLIQHLQHQNAWEIKSIQIDQKINIKAAFIIDATGPAGVLTHHLQLSNLTSSLQTHSRALFSHFDHLPKWETHVNALGAQTADYPFACDDAALHHIIEGGWMWMLRFADHRTSAGIVLDAGVHPEVRASPADEWQAKLNRYPSIEHLFSGASLSKTPGHIIRTGRLQRLVDSAAGPNWALLPHTAGFIDPLHSTGIAHSMCGIEQLMGIFEKHWQQDSMPSALTHYSNRVIKELKLIDLLVAGCYRSFGRFERLTAYLMLYFAAAITYEEARTAAYDKGDRMDRHFLLADDKQFSRTVNQTYHDLLELDPLSIQAERAFIKRIERRIEPFNTAGLFRPRIPNMYEYTAAEV